jgi:V-type H+-transporting ATPase subunit A
LYILGKESLSEGQKVTLEVAKIIREDFLQQNAFSSYDYNCPIEKSIGMLKVIVALYNGCNKVLNDNNGESGTTFAHIKTTMKDTMTEVTRMKFQLPTLHKDEYQKYFDKLISDLEHGFASLTE